MANGIEEINPEFMLSANGLLNILGQKPILAKHNYTKHSWRLEPNET